MGFHSAIERAIRNAPVIKSDAAAKNPLDVCQKMSDDQMLLMNQGYQGQKHEVVISASDSGLRSMLGAWGDVTGKPFDESYIKDAVLHEGQHASCARKLGTTSIKYGITVERVSKGNNTRLACFPFTIFPNLKITKLGFALICAHPSELSESDRGIVRALGYPGINELADIALRWNKDQKLKLFHPLPISVSR